jgi:hypothetical protein
MNEENGLKGDYFIAEVRFVLPVYSELKDISQEDQTLLLSQEILI